MKKVFGVIESYVAAKNEQESLTYANKITVGVALPLLICAAAANLILFLVFGSGTLEDTLINCVILLLFAAVLFLTNVYIKKESAKYNVIIAAFSAILLFVVVRYYACIGPAVWTISMISVVIAISHNSRRMILVLSATLLALGIYVTAAHRSFGFRPDYYAVQYTAFAVLFLAAAGVQHINMMRFRKIKHFLSESEMISRISSDFISISPDNLDEKINGMLEKTCDYYGVEFGTIMLLSRDQKRIRCGYNWLAGTGAYINNDEEEDIGSNPVWNVALKKAAIIPDVGAMDESQAPQKELLREMGVKAMISMPVVAGERTLGILLYASHNGTRCWKEEHKELLVLLTNLLGDALRKAETENDIKHLAYYDALTGMPNRFLFTACLDRAIAEAREKQKKIAVVFIDLDSFKTVNDTTGHEGGDALLKQVGARLTGLLGQNGLAAHHGGDEFILMIQDFTNPGEVRALTDRIMNTIKRPMIIKDQEFFIMASAGVAFYPDDGEDSNTLKKNADVAMNSAKESGKNQVVFCSSQIKENNMKNVRMTNLLYRALERKELTLHYQPLVDMTSKRIAGVEALLRWNQPEIGMVPPCDFIPLAERTGLIYPIGAWVLKTACRQNKLWQDAGLPPIRVAVNLSAEQLQNPNLVGLIRDTLAETGLEANNLELEVTESAAIKDTNNPVRLLREIKELGVTISIDDFGTEYSSLARVKQLPIDRIKMAMQFVHGIAISDEDEAIAKVIINLAENLGLKVIAEGVETESQLTFLKKKACDEVQGFYFYRPMPAEEIERILKKTVNRRKEAGVTGVGE